MNRIWKMTLLIVGLILIDQFTKGAIQQNFRLGESIPVIDGLFNITHVRNPGAAFGMAGESHELVRLIVLKVLPVFACFWLVYMIVKTRHEKFILTLAYSLILAGAIGNLIDRISLDYVVDFLDFHWGGRHFPAFNVADSAITIAAILLIFDSIFLSKKTESKA